MVDRGLMVATNRTFWVQFTLVSKTNMTESVVQEFVYPAEAMGSVVTWNNLAHLGNPVILRDDTPVGDFAQTQIFSLPEGRHRDYREEKYNCTFSCKRHTYTTRRRMAQTALVLNGEDINGNNQAPTWKLVETLCKHGEEVGHARY